MAALFADMSASNATGLTGLLMPLLKRIAARARARGLERELVEKYCR